MSTPNPFPFEDPEPEPDDDFDLVDFIIRFEGGELEDEDELVHGFQHLVDTGQVWRLQGFYGRTAQNLIDAGLNDQSPPTEP